MFYYAQFLTTQEEILSTYDRELCDKAFALSQNDIIIIYFALLAKEISRQDNIKLKCCYRNSQTIRLVKLPVPIELLLKS